MIKLTLINGMILALNAICIGVWTILLTLQSIGG
jgi:uncharacterized protein YlzI (FlbEa/FlbD family)